MKINTISNCIIVLAFIFIISFTITNIILVLFNPNQCQYQYNVTDTTIPYYIVSISTSNVIFILILFFNYITYVPGQMISNVNMITYIIINYVIGIIWLVIGEIVLFRDSNHCAINGSSHILYAVVIWILPLVHTIRKSCENRNRNESLKNVYVEI
jgi:hypothetical protein